jgi:hypothetical protein
MTQPALANLRFPVTGAPVDPLLLCARSDSRVGGGLRFRFPCKATVDLDTTVKGGLGSANGAPDLASVAQSVIRLISQ